MTADHQKQLDEVAKLFRSLDFTAAADAAESIVRSAVAVSKEELLDVTRFLVQGPKLFPIFGHTRETVGADALPVRLVKLTTEFFGPDHLAVVAARMRLAHTYSTQLRPVEATNEWEWLLSRLLREFPANDPRVREARDNLAGQYRNAGHSERAAALYNELDVCEHLQPVKQYILSQGGKVSNVGSPWSKDCRNWMYFDGIVLDADALRTRFSLPDFVVTHSHLGTHDGHELGLVCNQHQDAVMGPHPKMAAENLKLIS